MAAPPAQGLSSALFVVALIVLLLVRRTIALVAGTRYSPVRLFATAGLYVLLFAALGFTTVYAAEAAWGVTATLLVAAYAAVVVAAAYVASGYVRRIVRFEQREGGQWYYRLPRLVPLLSLGLFVVRFGVELWVFGFSATTSFLPTSLSSGVVALLIAIDLLFGVSVGLLLGRGAGVYRAFRERSASPPASASPPLPDS